MFINNWWCLEISQFCSWQRDNVRMEYNNITWQLQQGTIHYMKLCTTKQTMWNKQLGQKEKCCQVCGRERCGCRWGFFKLLWSVPLLLMTRFVWEDATPAEFSARTVYSPASSSKTSEWRGQAVALFRDLDVDGVL